MQQPVVLSPKFGGKSSHILMQSVQMSVVCGIDCLLLHDEFFVNNPLKINFSLVEFGISMYD
jgi:hypothetical protein